MEQKLAEFEERLQYRCLIGLNDVDEDAVRRDLEAGLGNDVIIDWIVEKHDLDDRLTNPWAFP